MTRILNAYGQMETVDANVVSLNQHLREMERQERAHKARVRDARQHFEADKDEIDPNMNGLWYALNHDLIDLRTVLFALKPGMIAKAHPHMTGYEVMCEQLECKHKISDAITEGIAREYAEKFEVYPEDLL